MAGWAYNAFERREGRRWRWTVLVENGNRLLTEYGGLTLTLRGARRATREAVMRDHRERRAAHR